MATFGDFVDADWYRDCMKDHDAVRTVVRNHDKPTVILLIEEGTHEDGMDSFVKEAINRFHAANVMVVA